MAEKPSDKASAAAASRAAAAYLDLWERHSAAIFRDNPWRGPRLGPAPEPEPQDHPPKGPTDGGQDG